jgi:hypothetical protein
MVQRKRRIAPRQAALKTQKAKSSQTTLVFTTRAGLDELAAGTVELKCGRALLLHRRSDAPTKLKSGSCSIGELDKS